MRRLIPLVVCCFVSFSVFAQSTTIKSTSGNGPILSGLRITTIEAAGNLKEFGSMLATPTTGSDEVDVRFGLSGKITQYRYNGKIYNTEYPDCGIFCGDCSSQKVKVTATIKAGGKTITRTAGELINAVGRHHFLIKLPNKVARNSITLVSLIVEPVPYPGYEAQLAKLADCQKKQEEKEKKEKEPEEEKVKNGGDFWNGSAEKPSTRKIVLNISEDDWWSGKEEKKESDEKETVEIKKGTPTTKNEALFPVPKAGLYGYINKKGELVIPYQFKRPEKFSNGLLRVEQNGKYGFMDKSGELVIPYQFDNVGNFSEGYAFFDNYKAGELGYIDTKGNRIFANKQGEFYGGDFSDGYAYVKIGYITNEGKKGSKGGFINTKGEIAIPYEPGYAYEMGNFSEGLVAYSEEKISGETYGYLDKTGTLVIPYRFAHAHDFSEGLASVAPWGQDANGNYQQFGFIDKTGNMVIQNKFNVAGNFSEGLAFVSEYATDNRLGYIDKGGNYVISPQFFAAREFSGGLAAVQNGDESWGYVDKKGVLKIPFQFYEAESFSNGLARVTAIIDGKYKVAYINEQGNFVWQSEE